MNYPQPTYEELLSENRVLSKELAAWEARRGDIETLVVWCELYTDGVEYDCAMRVLDMLAPETANDDER